MDLIVGARCTRCGSNRLIEETDPDYAWCLNCFHTVFIGQIDISLTKDGKTIDSLPMINRRGRAKSHA